ncbi:uncharacterized protein BDCG_01711 [Blastomyces dermatitidis ER-3]|uniref:Uncharacterized protein n=2 Tax=Ajellomyces dermatitidis TaxID=5039 RepID=F2T701_AJEDA|nr:uncharacterized protein BDCG_01711 [Blastomyces dermatitidis ER-3]EEQ86591.1 hypothetical protein BDCG_01711 [Blastomyces dermatitidis ER-3]EGE79014.1 hypothetical protein BDDG_01951 [Blastomyces dermatitidis ATCC 18188]
MYGMYVDSGCCSSDLTDVVDGAMLECDGGVASRQSKLGCKWEDAGNPKFHHNHSKVGTIHTTGCGKLDGARKQKYPENNSWGSLIQPLTQPIDANLGKLRLKS